MLCHQSSAFNVFQLVRIAKPIHFAGQRGQKKKKKKNSDYYRYKLRPLGYKAIFVHEDKCYQQWTVHQVLYVSDQGKL